MVAELAALPVFAWLLTYALHSTLLLAGAWLLTRALDRRALALRERVWKFAVLGGFATAAVQTGAGIEPLLGRVELALSSQPSISQQPEPEVGAAQGSTRDARIEAALAAIGAPAPTRAAFHFPPAPQGTDAPPAAPTAHLARAHESEAQAPAFPRAAPAAVAIEQPAGIELDRQWPLFALGSWLLAGLASLGLVAFGLSRLRRELAGALELEQGDPVVTLRRLATRAGHRGPVRLLVAPRLSAPLSTGWLRPRICLPPRALEELSPAELEAVLAHEVAHLARRDPPWLFLLWWIETVCFFQPLNRLARRELSTSFELSADAWAARATGDRLALAACLARIAGWVVGSSAPGAQRALGAAMADSLDLDRPRSRLGERILRLLDEGEDEGEIVRDERPGRLERAASLSVLAALALAVPGAAAVVPVLERAAQELAPVDEVERPTSAAAVEESWPATVPDLGSTAPALDPQDTELPAEELFEGLDDEMSALAEELELLRSELSAAQPDPRLSAALDGLQQRAQRLEDRRQRMQVVLEAILAQDPEHDVRRIGP